VSRIDTLLHVGLRKLPPKPAETVPQPKKKAYSEAISRVIAEAFAEEMRSRGLEGARPAPPGVLGKSGAERRMA
jgi:hypothetical protein